MEIQYNDFVQCCPAAQMPDPSVFENIGAQIQKWKDWARDLATPDIYDGLDNLDAEPITEDYDRLVRLRRNLVGLVCSMAFWDAIPQLDLVLTATGFGVVNNANVAPASAERVLALRTQMRRQGLLYLEESLDILRLFDVPKKSKLCGRFFRTLFWKAEHMHVFGIPNPTFDDLAAKMPQIESAHIHLAKIISPEQLVALIRAEASASSTGLQSILISMCRVLCVYATGTDTALFNTQRLSILGFMEDHLAEFPEYRDSETYKAIHFQRYENSAEDPCFFFG